MVLCTAALLLTYGITYRITRQYSKTQKEKVWEEAAAVSPEERTHNECLAMLVEVTYSRDSRWGKPDDGGGSALPVMQHWTRMEVPGVSEDDEHSARVACYVKSGDHPDPDAPKCVIAVHGTIPTQVNDLKDDVLIGLGVLATGPRYLLSEDLIRKFVMHFRKNVGGEDPLDIWIAGHSLGAEIAVIAGMKLAANDMKVSVCCFNWPKITVSSIVQTLVGVKITKDMLWNLKNMVAEKDHCLGFIPNEILSMYDSLVGRFVDAHRTDEEPITQLNQVRQLQMGPVRMCVNQADPICKEVEKLYRRNHHGQRNHFSNQAFLSKFVASILHIQFEVEPRYYPIPRSVTMFLSRTDPTPPSKCTSLRNLLDAHALKQWYSPDTVLKKEAFDLDGPAAK